MTVKRKVKRKKGKFDDLIVAAQQLPVGCRAPFILAFKGTSEPDIHNGDLKFYMRDIANYIKMREEDATLRCKTVEKIQNLLEDV